MASGAVQLRRDPFARTTLMREIDRVGRQRKGCAWCGDYSRRGLLWLYYWESDTGRRLADIAGSRPARAYCSIGCWETGEGLCG